MKLPEEELAHFVYDLNYEKNTNTLTYRRQYETKPFTESKKHLHQRHVFHGYGFFVCSKEPDCRQ